MVLQGYNRPALKLTTVYTYLENILNTLIKLVLVPLFFLLPATSAVAEPMHCNWHISTDSPCAGNECFDQIYQDFDGKAADCKDQQKQCPDHVGKEMAEIFASDSAAMATAAKGGIKVVKSFCEAGHKCPPDASGACTNQK